MEDLKQKKRSKKCRKGASKEISSPTKLEASDAGNYEPVDNFTDFLYWREPIGDLNLDDILLLSTPEKIDDNNFTVKDKPSKGEPEIETTTVISDKPSKIEANIDDTAIISNSCNVKVKSASSKRRPKTNKKQNSTRVVSNTSSCAIISENKSDEIGKFTTTKLQVIAILFLRLSLPGRIALK